MYKSETQIRCSWGIKSRERSRVRVGVNTYFFASPITLLAPLDPQPVFVAWPFSAFVSGATLNSTLKY